VQTRSVNAEKSNRLSVDISHKIVQPKLDKRKSNLHKIACSKTNIKKSLIIPEPENILHGNRKQNTHYIICLKDNTTKDISLSKQMLTESVSTLNKG